jgi:environmental stress-induced protein Ves
MRLIKSDDYQSMPWKNGGGTTTQIASHPENATTENFAWRISMATVNNDGPFSRFPETERTLIVLEGAGIELTVAGGKEERLTRDTEPFTFAADTDAYAKLIDGSILDLNVMTRRNSFSHRVHKSSGPVERKIAIGTIVLFACDVSLQVQDGENTTNVAFGDTVIFDDGSHGLKIAPEGPGNYYLVELIRS